MSSVGLSEWVLLALIGLIVLGPERLPRIANQLGSWIGQARRMTRVMKRQLEEEINLEKSNNIKPPDSTATTGVDNAAEHVPANEDDDSFSPAHDAESLGTGVADDEEPEAEETAAQEEPPTADRDEKEIKP
jgi:sec-independent protein translocase protein TatB